ncbi:hypothetical protein [uncultured Ruegeria sp.]|uniref:hypothetical protein n=1 Tax=uncultured Ruegeria sp. TaxID=259304 RepID=UPI00262EF05B|nr:hypothetical protein [uncultured Ruegeria sp.]
MNNRRLVNYIALPILLVAAVLGLYWVWGMLFLWWLVPSVMTGQTALVFDIQREDDPILFWAVAILWAVFGLMMIAASLFPTYAIWLV